MKFKDGTFKIYTALYGSWAGDIRIVFRVRIDREPADRAKEKGIKYYDRIIPASSSEIEFWLQAHPEYQVL